MRGDVRRQRAVMGGRERIGAGVEKRIRAAVEREARRFGVSMAFVQSVALADALGVEVDVEDRYDGGRLKVLRGGEQRKRA